MAPFVDGGLDQDVGRGDGREDPPGEYSFARPPSPGLPPGGHKPRRRGPFWTPIGGPFCVPIDTQGIASFGNAPKRIKSLCGAKPPQKLRWTNAGRWAAIGAMGISPGTLGAWADNRGSACLVWIVRPLYRGRECRFEDDRQRHLEQGWAVGCVGDRGSPWRSEARSGKTGRWRRRHPHRSWRHGLLRRVRPERADEDQPPLMTVRTNPRFDRRHWLRVRVFA
jgi:hypothetical protein